MLAFAGLRSLRLQLDNTPQRQYLAEGFSKLTALTTLELGASFTAYRYKPAFSAAASSQSPSQRLLLCCRQSSNARTPGLNPSDVTINKSAPRRRRGASASAAGAVGGVQQSGKDNIFIQPGEGEYQRLHRPAPCGTIRGRCAGYESTSQPWKSSICSGGCTSVVGSSEGTPCANC